MFSGSASGCSATGSGAGLAVALVRVRVAAGLAGCSSAFGASSALSCPAIAPSDTGRLLTGAISGQLKAEDAPKPEEQPAKPAATRTRAKATTKPAPEPVAEAPEQPEPENIPELPEDEQELSDPEPVTGGPFVPRDKDGNELDHKKIQVIAMQKGLPAFKAALEMATGGTVKALRDLEGQNMQGVYNYLMQQPNAK